MNAGVLSSGFQPYAELTSPDVLFGRNEPNGLLDAMVREIGLGTNYHVYGERRAGKSSLLHCSIVRIERELQHLVPVYLNFRLHNTIVGSANVHRFIVARILAAMYMRGQREFNADRFHCPLSIQWEPIYEALLEKKDWRIDGLFVSCIDQIQAQGYGVVLFIDEYEHLMINSYGRTGGFFLIRDLSARGYEQGAPKPLTFVMAGAELWQDICDIIGSPELNTAITSFDVGPISYAAFDAMWEHCLSATDEHSRAELKRLPLGKQDIYSITGGWPFYGKLVGHHALSGIVDESTIDGLLRPYFDIIWRRLGASRKLVSIAEKGPVPRTGVATMLARRGLFTDDVDGGGLVARGEAWCRYIREHSPEVFADNDSQGPLFVVRKRVMTQLEQVQRIVYADELERQATAESFQILDDWTERCTDVERLQTVLTELVNSHQKEALVVTDLAKRVRASI